MAVRRNIVATGSGSTRGVAAVLTNYQAFVSLVQADAKRIMEGAARIVLKHTIPWVPFEYGSLRESGIAYSRKTDKGWAGMVTFGGDVEVTPSPNAPQGYVNYALIVHEAVETEFKIGSAKYLEIGATEAKPEVDAYVASELRKLANRTAKGGRK